MTANTPEREQRDGALKYALALMRQQQKHETSYNAELVGKHIAALEAFADTELSRSGSGADLATTEEMLRICRSALLQVRDWQGENENGNTYRTPIGFKGSPFDYLRKLANDGLKASARLAWGIDMPAALASDRRALSPLTGHAFRAVKETGDE